MFFGLSFSNVLAQTTKDCVQDPNKPGTEYCLLAPIPLNGGNTVDEQASTSSYIPGLFRLMIAIATGLAVLMLIYAGIKYMSTDAFSGKEEAKGIISNAIWGLLLAISAWLIVFTINPKLVEFDLSIPVQEIKQNTNPSTGGASGSWVGVGCQGNCPYSYNSGGVVIHYRDCNQCSDANSFGLNIKQDIVNGRQTQINTELGNQLKEVQGTDGNPAFRVTETWPPTANHSAQGQYDGTSVDAALNAPNASNINAFFNNATANNLRVEYEVQSESQKQSYISAGVRGTIIVVPRITGEHFSVYKN